MVRRCGLSPVRSTVLLSNSTSDSGSAVAAALRQSGWKVEGADTRRLPLGIRSRHLQAEHLLPDSDPETYRQALSELLDRRRPDVFLPIGFAATKAACSLADEAGSTVRFNVPPLTAFKAAHDKLACTEACELLGIPVPLAHTQCEAASLLRTGGSTVVVKPACSPGAARGVHYVCDEGALEVACDAVARDFGKVQIQEYIPGGPSAMKTIVLLFSRKSRLVAAFTLCKIRQWPAAGGVTVVANSTAEFGLVEQMLPLFRHWRWVGPAEVELKQDPRDGRHKMIEINPRFPGYLRFPATCGLDLPSLTARLALDAEPIEAINFPGYAVGKRYLNPGLFFRSVAAEFSAERRWRTLLNVGRDLKGCGGHVASMLSDPLPALARMVYDARQKVMPT